MTCLFLLLRHGTAASSRPTTTITTPARRRPTRVTGFGSTKHPLPASSSQSPTLASSLPQQQQQQLWLVAREGGLRVTCAATNTSVLIQSPGPLDDRVVAEVLDPPTAAAARGETAVAVEALVGVYPLASGHVWVWVSHSSQVYESSPGEPPHEEDRPLYHIRKVQGLHLVHLPRQVSSSLSTLLSSRLRQQQRLEELRQRSLWRQALKDHDWYFGDRRKALVPDLTRSTQAFFAARRALAANVTLTPDDADLVSLEEPNDAPASTDSYPDASPAWYDRDSPLYPDSRFFWNEPVLVDAIATHTEAGRSLLAWAVPLTSAFVGLQGNLTTTGKGSQAAVARYDHLLISRRSRWRAGTRFTKRGADALGRVANYAETEQIIWRPSHPTILQSHVQTRGSIPLRWSSPTDIKTYRPRVRIGTDPLAQARSLQLHLAEEFAHYVPTILTDDDKGAASARRTHASLVLVNLVDGHSDQGRLGRALDAVLNAVLHVYTKHPDPAIPSFNEKGVRHVWFDFHAELKGGRWDRLKILLTDLQPALEEQGYFQASCNGDEGWKAERWQTGVMRTNCMDCLDRTNVVQGVIARSVLVSQLAKMLPLSYKSVYRKNPLSLPWMEGEKAHRLLWADNADAISRLYAGTPALKGDFTRTGKRTKKGALDDGVNSLQRYYLNNFLDADRQEGIDLVSCHQQFNYLDEGDEDENDMESSSPISSGGTSLRDAARQLLLGTTWQEVFANSAALEDESDHVRIKVGKGKSMEESFGSRRRELGLLWLPGDLQTQMRELAANPPPDNLPAEFSSETLLREMDRRSSSESPWWLHAASSSDESDADDATPRQREASNDASSTNPGFILAALVASCQAPLSTAAFILSVAGASVLKDSAD